ncbi:FmdB family zinc ribbon protein [Selenihalanaerobacter shriftii]|uniref:Putative regulatory protein, FmdB family n=1 Tax=Selenihalanaerobacter shriftii TaxID=142842 RepID=A0A1T4LFF9_9FIRM|nr:zinc ribbon domain-containing protein [Selenihalanaerobacter shriftii]SJZ53522.1 putative regulatory protein, FmdB family [Selenihalanaerobacter shriftii]
MPFYDFKCNNCGEKFTTRTSYSNIKEVACSKCDSNDVKRQFSAFSVGGNSASSNSGNGCSSGGG